MNRVGIHSMKMNRIPISLVWRLWIWRSLGLQIRNDFRKTLEVRGTYREKFVDFTDIHKTQNLSCTSYSAGQETSVFIDPKVLPSYSQKPGTGFILRLSSHLRLHLSSGFPFPYVFPSKFHNTNFTSSHFCPIHAITDIQKRQDSKQTNNLPRCMLGS
jgi:hypothetical protein